jgi:hypothetical protein
MIYFVQPAGSQVVKIGYAQHVPARFGNLQTAHAEELLLLGVLSGTEAKERELHDRFSHLRVRGEWFRYTPEIQEFLFEHVVPYSAPYQATDDELSPAAPLANPRAENSSPCEKAPVTVVVEQKPVPPISAPSRIERTLDGVVWTFQIDPTAPPVDPEAVDRALVDLLLSVAEDRAKKRNQKRGRRARRVPSVAN